MNNYLALEIQNHRQIARLVKYGFCLAIFAISSRVNAHGLPGGFGLGLAPEIKSFQGNVTTFGNISAQGNLSMLVYFEGELGQSFEGNNLQGKIAFGYFNLHSAYSRNRSEADFRYGYTVEIGGTFSTFSAPSIGLGLFYLAAEKILFQIKGNENFFFYGAKNGFEHTGSLKITYLFW